MVQLDYLHDAECPAECRMVQDPEKLQIPTLLLWGADDMALGPQLARQTPQFVENVEAVGGKQHHDKIPAQNRTVGN
ncbi:hypothetical protein ABBQ32_008309 [Trebouxia sp. C0010 RCD-2024]